MRKLIALVLSLALTPLYGAASKDFDGTNDTVLLPNVAQFNGQEGTISFWATLDSGGVFHQITNPRASDANYQIDIGRLVTGEMRVFHSAGIGTLKTISFAFPADSTWHHVAVTWSLSADQFKAYLDGTQAGTTQTGLGTWTGALNSFRIGSNVFDADYWDGLIVDFRLYDRALSENEVLVAKNCLNQPAGTAGHWMLVQDNDAYEDLSVNGNDGTCTNCPANSFDGPPTTWCEE